MKHRQVKVDENSDFRSKSKTISGLIELSMIDTEKTTEAIEGKRIVDGLGWSSETRIGLTE